MLFVLPLSAAQDSGIRLLYFFSQSCPHCIQARPHILELSKNYTIEGLQYGSGSEAKMPFPVKRGSDNDKKLYDIPGVPVLVMLQNGKPRQKFVGFNGIESSSMMIQAFSTGAVTVTEALANKTAPAGQETTIAAWVAVKGASFKDATYYLSDGKSELKVKPWLLREAMKSPVAKTGPRTMAEVVRKAVVLKGTVQWNADGPVFTVKKEIVQR